MLKKIIALAGMCLFLFYCGSIAKAESSSINVSVTIPAIPGVNTPLIEEEELETISLEKETLQQNAQTQEPIKGQSEPLIKEENKVSQDAQKPLILVKTLYDR